MPSSGDLKGFLPMSLLRYLELLDFTGRQVKFGKKGSIPASVQPLLQQLGTGVDCWFRLIEGFGRLFKRAAGSSMSLSAEAERRGHKVDGISLKLIVKAPSFTFLTA